MRSHHRAITSRVPICSEVPISEPPAVSFTRIQVLDTLRIHKFAVASEPLYIALMEKRKAVNNMKAHLPLQDVLKTELAQRCQKNPNYSLRAFAKSLELSPAFLSKLLKGDRPFTERTLTIVSEKLTLNPEQVEYYKQQISKNPLPQTPKSMAYKQISLDQFALISDWYHFAILELTTVDGFEHSPQWVAKQLGISVHQADDAIERLIRLNCLSRTKSGKLKLVEENNTIVGPEIAVPATRTQQTQFLEMAIRAMTETPIEKRSQSAVTMAIPQERVGEAKEIIAEFRRKFTSLMQRPGDRDSVYQLSISFFPLTKQ